MNHPVLPVGIATARQRSALSLQLGLLLTLKAIELATLVILMERLVILGQVMQRLMLVGWKRAPLMVMHIVIPLSNLGGML